MFDADPDKLVADGRPQPLVRGNKTLPDAVSVSINPVADNHQCASVVPGWDATSGPPPSSSAGLEGSWEISMVDFTALIQVRPRRLRSTRVQTSTGRVRAAA